MVSAVTSTDLKTKARPIEIEKEFPVNVKSNFDTYIITYYTYAYSTDVEMDRLIERSLEKHSIEVSKENVTIEYYN